MKRRYWQQQMCIKISHGYSRKSIETLNVLKGHWTSNIAVLDQDITDRRCNHRVIDCNRRLFLVPTLNRCPTIYERCLDLSAYLILSGAPGTWLLRLHLVYIQTSGSSDMPYMICDVLVVVFLERHILSHVLSLFCKFSHRLCLYLSYSGPVEFFYYPCNRTFPYCVPFVIRPLNWLYRIQSQTSLVK